MNPEVEQPLGDVDGPDAILFLLAGGRGDELVHAGAVVGHVIVVVEARSEVVGVEDGVFAHLAQSRRAVHADIVVGADVHAEVAIEAVQLADALRRLLPSVARTVFLVDANNDRCGQIIGKPLCHTDRP